MPGRIHIRCVVLGLLLSAAVPIVASAAESGFSIRLRIRTPVQVELMAPDESAITAAAAATGGIAGTGGGTVAVPAKAGAAAAPLAVPAVRVTLPAHSTVTLLPAAPVPAAEGHPGTGPADGFHRVTVLVQ